MGKALSKFIALTRFEQTLFSLPLILTAILLPFGDQEFISSLNPKSYISWLFILPAFLSARTAGISLNQLIDREIDALNPRTMDRPLPRSFVSFGYALALSLISLALFLVFSWFIHISCFVISCFSALLLVLYSYMKRIHWTCHFVLGLIYFLGIMTAFISLKGRFELSLLFLGCVAFFSVSASDILYALGDYAFDQKMKLHSIPSRFGREKSIIFARVLHGLSLGFMILLGWLMNFSWVYYLAPLVALVAYYSFHKKHAKGAVNFFIVNVSVSFSLFIFTLMALWLVSL